MPNLNMRQPQNPEDGKGARRYSQKVGSATDSVESNDVQDFDRGGYPGKRHIDATNPVTVIANYSRLGESLKGASSFRKIATEIARIAELAESTVMQEAGDWFDKHTISRNMSELKKYAGAFNKLAEELDTMHQRATALYDDMGNVLTRYFELAGPKDEDLSNLGDKKQPPFSSTNQPEEALNPDDYEDTGKNKFGVQTYKPKKPMSPEDIMKKGSRQAMKKYKKPLSWKGIEKEGMDDERYPVIMPKDDAAVERNTLAIAKKERLERAKRLAQQKAAMKKESVEEAAAPTRSAEAVQQFLKKNGLRVGKHNKSYSRFDLSKLAKNKGDSGDFHKLLPAGQTEIKATWRYLGDGRFEMKAHHYESVEEEAKQYRAPRVRQTEPQETEGAAKREASKMGFGRNGYYVMDTPSGWVAVEYAGENIIPEVNPAPSDYQAHKSIKTPESLARGRTGLTHDRAKDILRKAGAKTVGEAVLALKAAQR